MRDSLEETFMPLTFPLRFASSIKRLSPSINKMNSKGDRGHPYLKPLEAGKKEEDDPFIRTAKLAEEMQPRIQLTPIRGTPI